MTVKQQLRMALRGNSLARRAYEAGTSAQAALSRPLGRSVSFYRVPQPAAIRLAYQMMLRREPDEGAYHQLMQRLSSGALDRDGMIEEIRGSEEFQTRVLFSGQRLGHSIHVGRQQFIRALPKASVIVDLGGGHKANNDGALVALGYPYDFEQLTIVDLPSEDRHDLYKTDVLPSSVHTARGPVTYEYRSMVQLDDHASGGTDLVYSGQSIEHVPTDIGKQVLAEVFRILRPGGYLAIDTPNGRVTRVQQDEFIDPDHDVEYTAPELRAMLEAVGFTITWQKGLNYAGPSVRRGIFDADLVAGNTGLYDEIEDCYILCLIAQKPRD